MSKTVLILFWVCLILLLLCLLAGCGWLGRKPQQEGIRAATQIKKGQTFTPAVNGHFIEGKLPPVTTPLPVMPQAQKAISSLPWVVLLCVLGLGVSVALLVQGNKLGIAGVAGCGTTLVAAIVISQWLWLIAWVGGAIALAAAGLLIWRVWIHRKALSEVVWTAEEAKQFLDDLAREAMFGGESNSGKAGRIQSKSTEKIVAKIRANGE